MLLRLLVALLLLLEHLLLLLLVLAGDLVSKGVEHAEAFL
jgi:hypothetical protein